MVKMSVRKENILKLQFIFIDEIKELLRLITGIDDCGITGLVIYYIAIGRNVSDNERFYFHK